MSFPGMKIALFLLLGAIAACTLASPVKQMDEEIDLSQLGERIYGEPDENSGNNLRFVTPENITGNPEEMGNYAEGDILFLPSDLRNGVRAPSKRWPGGRVPYQMAGAFST